MTARVPLLALTLALAGFAGTLRAECPSHPADLAPGVLGDEMPVPVFTVVGDGAINVQDVLTLLQAAVSSRTLAWEEPFAEDCPAVPGDLAPGTEAGGIWSPDLLDGTVNVSDVIVSLRLAVNLIAMDPDYIRPVVAEAASDDRVVTGSVVDSVAGAGLPGVTVTAFSGESAVGSKLTDGEGAFFLQGLPAGTLLLEVDGSTSTAAAGKFSSLEIQVASDSGGTTTLRTITLPDAEDPQGASGKVTGDETGTVDEEITVSNGAGDVGLAAAPGAKIETDDGPADGEVDLSASELDGDELPGELEDEDSGETVDGTGAVAVSPADGKFTAGSGLLGLEKSGHVPGLDLTLPNRKNFPLGTIVSLFRWDGPQGRWLNLTTLHGSTGEVVDVGGGVTAIFAAGAATEGGIYAAGLPLDASCRLQVVGRVVDQLGDPLPGVFVDSRLGAYAVTDATGAFSFDELPAYVLDGEGSCDVIGFELVLRGGVPRGDARRIVSVPPDGLFPGSFVDLGDLELTVPNEACLSGLVRQNGVPRSGPVTLSGPDARTLTADAEGRFGVGGLTPGSYVFSFQFPGEAFARDFEAELAPRQCTTVRLEVNEGSGSRRIEVAVFYDDDDDLLTPGVPADGALVELRGSDAVSSGGLRAVAGPSGRVVFDAVDGPFQVLAVLDVPQPDPFLPPGTPEPFFRTGASLTTTAMPTNRVGLILQPAGATDSGSFRTAPGRTFGTISNVPAPGPEQVFAPSARRRGPFGTPRIEGFYDPASGFYDTGGWDEPYDLLFGLWDTSGFDVRLLRLSFFGPYELPSPASPGEVPELMQDLDYGATDPLLFDTTLGLTYTDFFTSANLKFIDLLGDAGAGRRFSTPLAQGGSGGPPPPSVTVPDTSSPGAAPWSLILEVNSAPTLPEFAAQSCLVPLPSPLPASLEVPFLAPPSINGWPFALDTPIGEIRQNPIRFSTIGDMPPNGYDALFYFSDAAEVPVPGEPAEVLFVVYLPPVSSQLAVLPPTPRPFLFEGRQLTIGVQHARSLGLPAEFETLFDDRVSEHFADLVVAGTPGCASDDNRVTYLIADLP